MDHREVEARVGEWIRSRWKGDPRCPRCLENDWKVKPRVALPAIEPDSTHQFLSVPVVPVRISEIPYTQIGVFEREVSEAA